MRSRVQALWSPLLAVVVMLGATSFGQTSSIGMGTSSVDAAGALEQQTTAAALCGPPRGSEQVPEPSAELRLVRDAAGLLWQVQSGCRHQVTPYFMDTATLSAIPLGEDASFVTYGFRGQLPTPSPLNLPAYAQLPSQVLRVPPGVGAPLDVTAPEVAPAGTLDRYASRVLVIDPNSPSLVYLLQGGMRHRVLMYYPLDVALADLDPSRAGDLASYALRGPQGYVNTISDVPWGEPAPLEGWGTGESVVISDRMALPDAVDCATILATPTPGRVTLGALTPLPTPVIPRRAQVACDRLRDAQEVSAAAYISDPAQYAGRDIRLVGGVACNVRYSPVRDGKSFTYNVGDAGVPGFAQGAAVQRDGRFASFNRLTLGTFVASATQTAAGGVSGEIIVFAYLWSGGGPCPTQGR